MQTKKREKYFSRFYFFKQIEIIYPSKNSVLKEYPSKSDITETAESSEELIPEHLKSASFLVHISKKERSIFDEEFT